MATSKDKHKVKYGPPPKAAALDVENYMRSRGDLPSFDSNGKDEKQEINDKLLQIISTGIDDIVLDLKKELGEDFESSNAKAFQISDILNQLKNANYNTQSVENSDELFIRHMLYQTCYEMPISNVISLIRMKMLEPTFKLVVKGWSDLYLKDERFALDVFYLKEA